MRDCDRVDSLLSAYIEQDASPAEVRFVDGHLTACARCRDQVRDLQVLMQRLRFLPRVETTPGFTGRVLAEAQRRAPAGLEEPVYPLVREPADSRGFGARWGAPLAAAAALAVVTWLGLSTLGGDILPQGDQGSAPTMAQRDARPTPALDFDRLAQARGEARESASDVAGSAAVTPPVTSLADQDPTLAAADTDPTVSLGMANDQYVLEDWILREPAGGGEPVLTRVGRSPDKPVVGSF